MHFLFTCYFKFDVRAIVQQRHKDVALAAILKTYKAYKQVSNRLKDDADILNARDLFNAIPKNGPE